MNYSDTLERRSRSVQCSAPSVYFRAELKLDRRAADVNWPHMLLWWYLDYGISGPLQSQSRPIALFNLLRTTRGKSCKVRSFVDHNDTTMADAYNVTPMSSHIYKTTSVGLDVYVDVYLPKTKSSEPLIPLLWFVLLLTHPTMHC